MQTLTFALLMVTTFQAFAQTDSTLTQRDSVISRRNDTALPAYLALKDALLVSDPAKAAAAAQTFANELIKVRLRSHELNNLMTLKKLRTEAIDEAKAIAATTDINVQRKHFATVSKDFW